MIFILRGRWISKEEQFTTDRTNFNLMRIQAIRKYLFSTRIVKDTIHPREHDLSLDHLAKDTANRPAINIFTVSHAKNHFWSPVISRHHIWCHHKIWTSRSCQTKIKNLGNTEKIMKNIMTDLLGNQFCDFVLTFRLQSDFTTILLGFRSYWTTIWIKQWTLRKKKFLKMPTYPMYNSSWMKMLNSTQHLIKQIRQSLVVEVHWYDLT